MKNFVVSARKYRPQRFVDVVGQGHVAKTLKNALVNDHLAHAFLFCGPRGVGKTTCARILAKTLNCTNLTEDNEACNTCSSCVSFNDNASFNIIELDAASNNSVDHIRALIEKVRFAPQQGEYRVFIIDEVHMLSTSAFNAFLKTLEEPPKYAIFILATTEKHKILPTILSRCQIFDFRRIQLGDIVDHLSAICIKEKIEADPDALHVIAQKADGALRDALSIFDRMVSFGGDKLTYDDIISNLNILDYDYFFKIVDALLIEDISTLLNLFDTILSNGFEPDIFIEGLMEHIRNLLVCQSAKTLALLEVSEGLRDRYKNQANVCSPGFLITALNLANECDINYRMAKSKRLHIEMGLIKMAYIQRAQNVAPMGQTPTATEEKKTIDRSEAINLSQNTSASPPVATTVSKNTPPPAQDAKSIAKENLPPEIAQIPASAFNEELPKRYNQAEESAPFPQEEVATTAPAPPPPAVTRKTSPSPGSKTSSLLSRFESNLMSDSQKEETYVLPGIDRIKEVWSQEAEILQSPTAKNILRYAKLFLHNNELIVKVGSKMGRDMVINEVGFSRKVKKVLKYPKLIMRVEVDPTLVTAQKPDAVKKVLSIKETYELMKTSNPSIDDLRSRFDLKIDQ